MVDTNHSFDRVRQGFNTLSRGRLAEEKVTNGFGIELPEVTGYSCLDVFVVERTPISVIDARELSRQVGI